MNPLHSYSDGKGERPASADQNLIQRVAAGDQEAFGLLYQRYHLPLYNFLLRLVRENPAAEDLLQEVFVAVWKGAGGFRGQAQVKTWLYRIAHHQAVSWLRRLRPEASLPDGEGVPASGHGPEVLAEMAWRADRVWQALDRLTPQHRAVVELAYVHAFSYAEIADILDCPVGTVKSRMSYALRYMNAALQDLGVDG